MTHKIGGDVGIRGDRAGAASGGGHLRLLEPVRAGGLEAVNRVWMAPLTRARATMPGNVPSALNARYYAQRAAGGGGAGVIISEATPISQEGYGYYGTPWIVTDAQVAGWRLVTDAVHQAGGLIVCQLWHVGRVSHAALQPGGGDPVGPTDVASASKTYIDEGMERVATSKPRALRTEEMPRIEEDFRAAAMRAKEAGFDGVEIHGANTYLLDQFTRDGMNLRTDRYGGSLVNRLRLPLEVAEAVCGVCGADRVGYRISPLSEHHDARDSDPEGTFGALAFELGRMGMAFLHAVETWDRKSIDPRVERVMPRIVERYRDGRARSGMSGDGVYVANGDYTVEEAEAAIVRGWCDVVAFGKLFISNPDLAGRIKRFGVGARVGASGGEGLNAWETETFYRPAGSAIEKEMAHGYTTYRAMAD
ncbi:alkene reductase [Nodularia spumigena]|uniref:alkene reductase n=1 Tax=Nodularia spumigena TaxID=70799 RepID=UPI002B215A3A|nr:alkene reductase [Nodularia spumigena]MEA5557632.1 alkene reductase [Nodularia spumigena CH309]